MEDSCGLRGDLHLHSSASGTATNVWVKGFGDELGVRESYTPPEAAYRMVKQAGMDLATLTDHESIEGTKKLLQHRDFFVGEEVCAVFPEDGTSVDVLVYGVDGVIHPELQARRADVHSLVAYLREERLAHVLAHPVYDLGGRLDRDAIERRLVLFGVWEFINGSRPAGQNRLAREIAQSVCRSDLRIIAARHGLPEPPHGRISGTGGSDDHGGIYGGTTFTVAPDASTKEEFIEALRTGAVHPGGMDGSVGRVTHTAFRLIASAVGEGSPPPASRAFTKLLPPKLLAALPTPSSRKDETGFAGYLPLLSALEEREVRSELSSRYEKYVRRALEGSGSGFPALDFLGSFGTFTDAHMFIAPYVAVHGYYGREERKARTLREEMLPGSGGEHRVGVFVDGMGDVHGVATLYRNICGRDIGSGWEMEVVCCGDIADDGGGGDFRRLPALSTLKVPLYEGLELGVPSLLDVLDLISQQEYEVLHVATPGPLGLAALISGLILEIPVVGAYHTEFSAYAHALSGDRFVENIVEVAVREFYERCDAVAVPSQATALALRNRGYSVRDYHVMKNGLDTALFSPDKRDDELREKLGGGRKLLLYVGRVSREKGLERLLEGYLELLSRRAEQDDVHLVVVGDGPYRREMQGNLQQKTSRVTFTGFLRGEELAQTYASADVFVFPSLTDTLGRAVTEAQSSGVPAVVYDVGGPGECIVAGKSGFSVKTQEEFFGAIETLLDDDVMRHTASLEARRSAEGLDWNLVREGLLGLHSRIAERYGKPEPAPRGLDLISGSAL